MEKENELLKILLSDEEQIILFHHAYVYSNHQKNILKIMNDLLKENPGYYLPLYFLNNFSVQIWAEKIREENKIGLDYLYQCLINSDGLKASGFFGITTHTGYKSHKDSLIETSKLMIDLESLLGEKKYKILKDLHIKHADISLFMINKYYHDSLKDFCEEFKCDAKGWVKNNIENEEEFVYHNTDILLRNMKQLKRYALFGVSNEVDYALIYETLNACIESLNSFPFIDDLYIPVLAYSKGIVETTTSKQIGKSRKYVRNKRIEGLKIISQILWGYAPY